MGIQGKTTASEKYQYMRNRSHTEPETSRDLWGVLISQSSAHGIPSVQKAQGIYPQQ